MQNRREEIDRRRSDLAERQREQDSRRKALDERKHLYQQEVRLEEEERRLNEEEERLLQEHERLDHLELGLEYEEHLDSDAEEIEEADSFPLHAALIAIGILVILFAAFSWFDPLGNIFGIAGFVCLVLAIWKAFKDEDRSVDNLRLFLGGIAFFWGGALLIALCGAISGIYISGFFSFLNFLSALGNGILIIAGISVCIYGFAKSLQDRRSEVSGE